jgi:predicted anti-sigma-YlaC factor YlaD
MRRTKIPHLLLVVICAAPLGACSVQKMAVNALSDLLASGDTALLREDDPELVADALPFTLKLLDSLLLQQPEQHGLLLAAAGGYVLYGYGFVGLPADRVSRENIDAGRQMRDRARKLFLRAHAYASRALQVDYPGIGAALLEDPRTAVLEVGDRPQRDVETLYWMAAALGLAISEAKDDPSLLARIPEVEALLNRALSLDEAWDEGMLHEFAVGVGGATGADTAEIQRHYRRALELSGGKRAGLFVSYAEAVALPQQDRAAFVALLERALAVDLHAYPNERLRNILAQRRARWLLSRLDELFLE